MVKKKETAQEIIKRIKKEKVSNQLKKAIGSDNHSTLSTSLLTEIEKNLKNIHCEKCNEPVPEHLLRGMFYKIIVDSKAVFKLLITGKSVGKTTNLILFQA